MNPGRRIRLGMVGGGEGSLMGDVHRMAARLDDRFELVAGAFSADPQRSRHMAQALHLEPGRCYADWQSMARQEAARDDGIDVVAVVTPNHLHVPVARAFVAAGVDVLCDKPLATDLQQALQLAEDVRRSSVIFAVTYNYSAYPMVRQAREMVAAGTLGEIRVVQVEYAQDWLCEDLASLGHKQAAWRDDPQRAGPAGALGDIGCHAFHLATFVTGLEVEQVSAELHRFVDGRRLDDNAQVMLRLSQGARGALWASQVAPGNANGLRLRVFGSLGGLVFDQQQPDSLWYTPLGQPTQHVLRGSLGLGRAAQWASRVPPGHPEGYLEGFAQLYRDYAEAFTARAQGRPVDARACLPDIAAGLQGMAFIGACLASHEGDGAWQRLEPVWLPGG